MQFKLSINQQLLLFILLSVLMILCGQLFYVHSLIDHPQFSVQGEFQEYIDRIKRAFSENPWQRIWYYGFFLLDLIWAPIGLTLIYRWVERMIQDEGFWQTFRWSLIASLCLAYMLDIGENFLYVSFRESLMGLGGIRSIIGLKTACYALVFLHLIIALYQEYFIPNRNSLWKFIKSSFLSLLIILVLAALITLMDQGATVVVDLFADPVNIVFAFLLLNGLAMACSHFPDYIKTYLRDPPGTKWKMHPDVWLVNTFGIGLITYTRQTTVNLKEPGQAIYRQTSRTTLFDHLRKNMGTLFLVSWIYVLCYVFEQFVDERLPLGLILLVNIFGVIFLYRQASKVKDNWKFHFQNHEHQYIRLVKQSQEQESRSNKKQQKITPAQQEIYSMMPGRVKNWLLTTLIGFVILIALVLTTAYVAYLFGWSSITWVAMAVTTLVNIIVFVLFRVFRTTFSYYQPPRWLRWISLHRLSVDVHYVVLFSIIGYLSIGIILYAHIFPVRVNALVLILAYLYVFYGVVIIPLKHRFFYKRTDNLKSFIAKHFTGVFFRHYLGFAVLLLIGYGVFMGQRGNTLHYLKQVPEDYSRLVDMREFSDRLEKNLASGKQPLRLLASYGGGLRANLWTQLLLDRMETKNDSFFHTMAGMSGVSGGFLGISFYSALNQERTSRSAINNTINTLGTHNFLTSDLAYLLGWDLFREIIPRSTPFKHPDRAGRSMLEYARVIQPDAQLSTLNKKSSYKTYWSKLFRSKDYWPALIGNTTGTHSKYGVCFSVKSDEVSRIFPGADDILTVREPGNSLPFLDAVSTTNRFPVFSPTAQIPYKGHYLDGGYFENSGLLSLINFYDYLQNNTPNLDSLQLKKGTQVIQIINSKDAYIKHLLNDYNMGKEEKAIGELGAITRTVTSIGILPAALEAKYRQQFTPDQFIQILLPYPVTYEDVTAALNGLPDNPFAVQALIEASNQEITNTLDSHYSSRWGTVAPPLARVLSEPAYRYMEAMLEHPEVVASLNRLQ